MFEKEAIRHAFEDTIGVECLIKPVEDFTYEELSDEQQEKAYDFKKGAEFGYNKANEWHKPSEKLPEECSLVLAHLFEETEPTICKYVVSNQWECLPKRIVFCSNDQVRKWKEIVPPDIKEQIVMSLTLGLLEIKSFDINI